ncbi:hypothetical protein [Spongiibacter tropicus]|uniref:hypothetical protein n=1 Tax=Spongiibacter tropicus TaxID=454602 RepID=UPI0003B69B9B|nr:hypothetical protein [Spongiibacter tropicus]
MATEEEKEVYRALRESQGKYTYFLLAAAGTAVGFSLTQTASSALSLCQLPLAAALLFWGLSFYLSCKNLAYVNSTLFANYELLRVENGRYPELSGHPQMVQAASEGIRGAIKNNSDTANQLGHWQFRMLITGSVSYIVWHVIEMWLRT